MSTRVGPAFSRRETSVSLSKPPSSPGGAVFKPAWPFSLAVETSKPLTPQNPVLPLTHLSSTTYAFPFAPPCENEIGGIPTYERRSSARSPASHHRCASTAHRHPKTPLHRAPHARRPIPQRPKRAQTRGSRRVSRLNPISPKESTTYPSPRPQPSPPQKTSSAPNPLILNHLRISLCTPMRK